MLNQSSEQLHEQSMALSKTLIQRIRNLQTQVEVGSLTFTKDDKTEILSEISKMKNVIRSALRSLEEDMFPEVNDQSETKQFESEIHSPTEIPSHKMIQSPSDFQANINIPKPSEKDFEIEKVESRVYEQGDMGITEIQSDKMLKSSLEDYQRFQEIKVPSNIESYEDSQFKSSQNQPLEETEFVPQEETEFQNTKLETVESDDYDGNYNERQDEEKSDGDWGNESEESKENDNSKELIEKRQYNYVNDKQSKEYDENIVQQIESEEFSDFEVDNKGGEGVTEIQETQPQIQYYKNSLQAPPKTSMNFNSFKKQINQGRRMNPFTDSDEDEDNEELEDSDDDEYQVGYQSYGRPSTQQQRTQNELNQMKANNKTKVMVKTKKGKKVSESMAKRLAYLEENLFKKEKEEKVVVQNVQPGNVQFKEGSIKHNQQKMVVNQRRKPKTRYDDFDDDSD